MKNILLKNAVNWVDASIKTRIASSVLIILAFFVARWLLDGVLKPYFPTQFFFVAAILIATLYGYVPALVSLAVGWFLGMYFFVEPYREFTQASTYDIVVTANNFATGIAGIALVEYLQRTRYSRYLNLLVSESRYRSLLRLDNHRLHQQRQSRHALRQMSEFVSHLDRVLLVINHEGQVQLLPTFEKMTLGAVCEPPETWVDLVHHDDRDEIQEVMHAVMHAAQASSKVAFRIATSDSDFCRIDCVFAALPVDSQRRAFALSLKPNSQVRPSEKV